MRSLPYSGGSSAPCRLRGDDLSPAQARLLHALARGPAIASRSGFRRRGDKQDLPPAPLATLLGAGALEFVETEICVFSRNSPARRRIPAKALALTEAGKRLRAELPAEAAR